MLHTFSFHAARLNFRKGLLAGTALVSVAIAGTPAQAGILYTLPSGGQVTAGQAAISQIFNSTIITQTSPKAVLTWQSFDISSNAWVTFKQPSSSSVALNRVIAGDASQINGHLSANGQVVLVNPNGVVFGSGATVNVGGLVASTLDLTDSNFMNGNMTFNRNGATGSVVNNGSITAANGGYAALLGPKVTNTGSITATLGTVALVSGEVTVLSFSGNSLVDVIVQPSTVASLIKAGGIINVGGGKVLVSASAANALLGGAINADGVIEADSLSGRGGLISLGASGAINLAGANLHANGGSGGGSILIGGSPTASVTVDAASQLAASATTQGNGGWVSVSSNATAIHGTVVVEGGAGGGDGGYVVTGSGGTLDVAGAGVDVGSSKNLPGIWGLESPDFQVTSSNNGAIAGALAKGGVGIWAMGATSGASATGDIVVAAPISWNTNEILNLVAYHGVQVNAGVAATGAAARLTVFTNSGGSGGSFATGSGGSVALTGANASLGINGQDYTLIHSLAQLQAMGTTGSYALAQTIDGGGANFTPIGFNPATVDGIANANPAFFSGTLEGLGNQISNLTITNYNSDNLGLISAIAPGGTGMVRDLGLSGVAVSGGGAVSFPNNIGVLAGRNYGSIVNSSAAPGSTGAGKVTIAGHGWGAGGLVGLNMGTISGSWTSVPVTSQITAGNSAIGGLAGINWGLVSSSYAIGTVGSIAQASQVGGLVGVNYGTITKSFANGGVSVGDGGVFGNNGVSASDSIGGLVGTNGATGIIQQSSANGAGGVSAIGAFYVGGLVGDNAGQIAQSLETAGINVQGGAYVGGLVGRNTGTIFQTYAIGPLSSATVSSTMFTGGLVGANSGQVTSSFWDMTTTGITSSAGGTGLLPADWLSTTKGPRSQSDWLNAGVWQFVSGKPYPVLLN